MIAPMRWPTGFTPMTAAHLPEVLSLDARVFTDPWPAEWFRAAVRDPQQSAAVLTLPRPAAAYAPAPDDAGGVVAYFVLQHRCLESYLSTLAVTPRYRRLGLARRCLQCVEQLARAHARTQRPPGSTGGVPFGRGGATTVRLTVGARNLAAQRLYEKQGYKRVRRISQYYSGSEDAYEMQRRLQVREEAESLCGGDPAETSETDR